MPLSESFRFLSALRLSKAERQIAGDLLNEATHRLNFLIEVGLDYLTLNRGMPSLSGGESQRIRLAGQIGRSLTGVLYVLDEPTIGLHPRDNGRLLAALKRLRDLGNTVLLVEHDREVLQAADQLYDFGPGAGRLGGNVVASGTPAQMMKNRSGSLTGQYLSGAKSIPVPPCRRTAAGTLSLLGATQHNLRNVDLHIPLGTLTCITGVSGSGKSSLLMDTLARAVARRLNLSTEAPGPYRELRGIEHLSRIVIVDQNPIGNTPASNPATYTGVFDEIRELFCRMPESRIRGYRPGRFSFNRAGGRCEDCEGMGQRKIEMHFLPDVWVECPTCRGRRFNAETLTVRFNECSIADVLEMPIEKALQVFSHVPKIRAPLATLDAIGLGYLTLGQSAPTLSGGEAQRLKLAAELSKPNRGRTLFLLDEPTTGLHFDDIARLLMVLNSLIQQGNSVVVIEHNPDVIKTADWIVDIGPEAGAGGGRVVTQGTPEDVVQYAQQMQQNSDSPGPGGRRRRSRRAETTGLRSWTGEVLAAVLAESSVAAIETLDVDQLAQKKQGDVSLSDLGKSALLPWEVDGPRWHLIDRVSHGGTPCRWEGDALKLVVDLLGKRKQLSSPNWNHRSTVEVRSHDGTGWFLHARTGGEWLLPLCFRVRKNTFTTEELDRDLGLLPLDELKDVQAYGREPRVKARNLRNAWQEVTVKVHSRDEIDTPEFRRFLDQAADAFLEQAHREKANPADLMPWKQLGRKWHLMRKSLPLNGRIPWEFELIEVLLPQIEERLTECEAEYGIRSKINWKRSKDGLPMAELHTRKADGVDLVLFCDHDTVTIGSIAGIGSEQEIRKSRDGRDAVRVRFTTVAQVRQQSVMDLLCRCSGL